MPRSTKPVSNQLTFAVLATGVVAYALLQSLVAPILPLLQHELNTSQDTVTWVLTAYLLSASVCTPIVGRIGDMMGKKKVLVAALAILAAGSILAALATTVGVMIIARVIQGVGGGVIPLGFGVIRDQFPREKVAGAVGLLATLVAIGGGLGAVLAGPIVNTFNYHWIFWIPAAVVIIAAVATFVVIPESPSRVAGRINWLAAVLLSAWLVALLLGVSEAPDWGWGSSKVIGLLVAAVVLCVIWVFVELHSRQPLIDMHMMRIQAVWSTNLVAFLVGIGLYSVFAFIPAFVQTPSSVGYGFGSSVTEGGLIILPMTVAMFFAGVFSGRLAARFGAKAVLMVGTLIGVVPFLMLGLAHQYIWEIAIAMGLLGASFGLAFAAMSSIVVEAVPASQTGVASGMNANIRTIGGAIGAALLASVITATLLPDGYPKEAGYTAGFLMLAGIAVLAPIATLFIPRLRASGDPAQAEQLAMSHPEAALVPAATIVGDLPE